MDTKPGDRLFLLAGAEELGNWHRDCAVEMKTNRETFPKWSCEVDLAPASLMGFEYKYYCVRRDGRGEWEPRGNRSFIKPESGNVVKDGAFGDPDPGDKHNTSFWTNCAHVDWVSQQLGKLHQEISPMQVSISEYHQRLAQWGPAWKQLESLQRSHEKLQESLQQSLEESQANQERLEKNLKRVEREVADSKIEIKRAQPKTEDLLSKLRDDVTKLCRDELAVAKARADAADMALKVRLEKLEKALGDLPRAAPKAGVPSQPPQMATSPQASVQHTGTNGAFLAGGMAVNAAMPYSPPTMPMPKVTHPTHPAPQHTQTTVNGHGCKQVPVATQQVSNASNRQCALPKADPPKISLYQTPTSQPRTPARVKRKEAYFPTPPHPEDEKSREITLEVEYLLVDAKHRNDTPEEKRKLLKRCNLLVHPDKQGTHEAQTWFDEWKQLHPAYLEGLCEEQRFEKLMGAIPIDAVEN